MQTQREADHSLTMREAVYELPIFHSMALRNNDDFNFTLHIVVKYTLCVSGGYHFQTYTTEGFCYCIVRRSFGLEQYQALTVEGARSECKKKDVMLVRMFHVRKLLNRFRLNLAAALQKVTLNCF
jgi:hypothetical protein